MALSPALASIIGWLRAGYPEGVPEHDYIPLFALLTRRLTESEVAEVEAELTKSGDSVSAQAIRDAISALSHHTPLEADVIRVSARLAASGWPLATLERATP